MAFDCFELLLDRFREMREVPDVDGSQLRGEHLQRFERGIDELFDHMKRVCFVFDADRGRDCFRDLSDLCERVFDEAGKRSAVFKISALPHEAAKRRERLQ
jgi:hypothetical protein